MQFLGCRLCCENHPLVASLRPLTAPCKACVQTSSGQRLAVHSNLTTGLRVETKLLSTRTLAHTHTLTLSTHTHTFHTHPKCKNIEWPAILCPLGFFPLGFVDLFPDSRTAHTHQHTSQSRCTTFGWTALLCPLDLFPPGFWSICALTHAHTNTSTHHTKQVCIIRVVSICVFTRFRST